jgi:hypothetical protein
VRRLSLPISSRSPPSLSGGNLILTYPLWAATNTLQFATNFAPGAWTAVNAVPVTNGDNVVVTLPITVNPMYFRLRP